MNTLNRKLAELFKKYEHIKTADELVSTWLNSNKELNGTTILYSFDEVGNELPIQPAIGFYENEKFYIQSIFSKPKIYLLNEKVWLSMCRNEKFPISSELLLDTQFGNYAVRYINDKEAFLKKDVGSSFETLLTFICRNDITFNFSFYNFENYANYLVGNEKAITNQLFALHKLANMDRGLFLAKGIIKLPFESKELKKKVVEHIQSYNDPITEETFFEKEVLHTNVSAIILKAALLKRTALSKEEKVSKLVDFMAQDLSVIYLRELVICGKWLLGEKVSLFDPINAGPNLHELPKNINGIAWDLLLLRHVETFTSLFKKGVPTVAYFSSFDRRLVEASKLYDNKGCLFPNKSMSKSLLMIPDMDVENWLSSVIGETKNKNIFNIEERNKRQKNRPSHILITTLKKQLEFELIKVLSHKKT
jgi:hypothetical protein